MTVETATKISQLNPLGPPGSDPKAEGDNHLRLIKSCLQAVFDDSGTTIKTTLPIESPAGAKFTGPVTVTGDVTVSGVLKTGGAAQENGAIIQTVLTASGTYTKPAGVKAIEVWCVGGGGAGSRAGATGAGTGSAGGGGGGGGVCMKLYKASDLAATEAYVVGAGGVGGQVPGTNGGNTTFKGLTAGGGGGGGALMSATASFSASAYGGGGTSSGGDLNMQGSFGTQGWANLVGAGGIQKSGGGGGSHFAPGVPEFAGGAAITPLVGRFPGGGSGGGANGANQASGLSTLDGGAGVIIIREYY